MLQSQLRRGNRVRARLFFDLPRLIITGAAILYIVHNICKQLWRSHSARVEAKEIHIYIRAMIDDYDPYVLASKYNI